MQSSTRPLGTIALLALLALAGCLGSGAVPAAGAGEPGSTELAHCSGNETTPGLEAAGDIPASADGFELRSSAKRVERGETVTFELTNVADERQTTGTRHRYALQRRVGRAWATVTQFPSDRSGFNATAVVHDPGTGFEWTVRANAAGFSDGKFVVCERLFAGQYRFVYDAPQSVAVEFELTEG